VIPREFPPDFRKNILGAFANGAAWLDSLPEVIAWCERHWRLTVGPPFELSYSYVAPARNAHGEECVLKVCPGGPGFTSEIEALQAWSGGAAVQLLDHSFDLGAVLLERLTPGRTLARLDNDDEATPAALASTI
jgi:streptomycin 6-kinase